MLVGALIVVAGAGMWLARDTLFAVHDATPAASATVAVASAATTALPSASTIAAPLQALAASGSSTLGAPTIRRSPTQVVSFDGDAGKVVIDRAEIEDLKPGQYIYAQYGEHLVAHRVHRKEVREDHTYVALDAVDPVDGQFIPMYSSYHLYEGSVSHTVNHPKIAFEVQGPVGEPLEFVNRYGDAALEAQRKHMEAMAKQLKDEHAH
jgi:hypothetical protein